MKNNIGIYIAARECLVQTDREQKIRRTLHYTDPLLLESIGLGDPGDCIPVPVAGFPEKPELIPPGMLPKRGFTTLEQRLGMLHAIAHIEFNAINIAWDAVSRYHYMPREFTLDWAKVAGEEARHFCLLNDLLEKHGMCYGDLPAHGGLWDMVERTAEDVLWRMAIIPRVFEARGLDVTPEMITRFSAAGDEDAAHVLSVIYEDEIGHVKTGDYWFKSVCSHRRLDSESTFIQLFDRFVGTQPATGLNVHARRLAGFSDSELEYIASTSGNSRD